MSGLMNHVDPASGTISTQSTALEAARLMRDLGIGALTVLEGGRPIGVLSERDLMTRVICERMDPSVTPVGTVMSAPAITVLPDEGPEQALQRMHDLGIRHLPVVDAAGRYLGMLSVPHLAEDEIEILRHECNALESYAGFDGLGG